MTKQERPIFGVTPPPLREERVCAYCKHWEDSHRSFGCMISQAYGAPCECKRAPGDPGAWKYRLRSSVIE